MNPRQIVAGLLMFSMVVSGPASALRADAQSPPPAPVAPPAPDDAQAPAQATEVTPPRVSYIYGDVSFWRPGAEDWAPAMVNTPLAPGDVLYTGSGGNVELQVGPRAFVRAAENTQLGLDNHEPDFLQLRVTNGHAALDLREARPGFAVELDTPNAAFTVERAGYYRLDVAQDSTTFHTHRGGVATMTPASGAATPIPTNQQLVVTGTDSPSVQTTAAPPLTAWDRWNYQRTAYLLQPASHVPAGVYGTETLEQHGSWRTVETYGSVWAPSGVPAGWVPYSTGRWIWDARFGWTWLDDAPWGWAPYHYGRWVFVGSYWAWAPGPVFVRPVYAPALVVFLGGGVGVGFGVRPLCWAPLAWGEPLIPWWGRPGFIGVASWRGWGGPRVVNNVVVNRTTNVNVTNINVYRNVTVTNAVVGVSADRFGRHHERPQRIADADVRQLMPVRGALDVKPVPASVTVSGATAARPPAAFEARGAVATRRPHDTVETLRTQGIATTHTAEPPTTPRIVPSPRSERGTERATVPQNGGRGGGPSVTRPGRGPDQRRDVVTPAPQSPTPAPQSQPTPSQPSAAPTPPGRSERQERGERPNRGERQDRSTRGERVQPAAPAPPQQQSAPSPQQPAPGPPQATPPQRQAVPPSPPRVERQERGPQPTAPGPQRQPAPPGPQPQGPGRTEPPANRSERQERGDRQDRGERPDRGPRPERTER